MERISDKGFASKSCSVLVHRAKQAAHKEWSELKNQLVRDEKKVKPEAALAHVAALMDLCHLRSSELLKYFQKYAEELFFKETPSKMMKVTVQSSRTKEHRLPKLQQQDPWTRFVVPFFCVTVAASDAVSAYTQVKKQDAPSWGIATVKERVSSNLDLTATSSTTQQVGQR